MTDLRLPFSMPHATTSFPRHFPQPKLQNPQLLDRLYHSTSSTTQASTSYYLRNLTPPSEMNMAIDRGRILPQTQVDGLAYGSRPLNLHQPLGQPCMARHSHHSSYSNSSRTLPSPSTLRPSAFNQEPSRVSESNVAPYLQIPDEVKTPQHSMPRLAAEVCIFFATKIWLADD
jgi:hypothetical protein